ncbi:putative hydrolase of the HAD superfamily [Zeaxanthinibacter enoshimensis]|uniref:Putative hydrolase of the HAD superfamily n=1 Tax=Zeaxanthinibacter enoshimensis TaxID=392009 RepID=A0A4R6TMR1_9FLAO|nr:putative hydrolase of the HAD superfamily [Zeaxanthinibacter enoshimensis]
MMKYWSVDIKVDEQTLIVFDLDDTLYNEIDFLRSAYELIAKKIRPDEWKLLFSSMFSRYRCGKDVFEWLSATYGCEKNDLLKMYRYHKPDISLFDGAEQLLKDIRKNGGSLGILTDGRSLTQRNKIEALGITEFFKQIIISEEIGTEKPNRRNFDVFETNEGFNKYYYIADNFKKDFLSPNQLSWTTIGLIDNGKNIHKEGYKYMEEERLRPHYLVGSFHEIRII